MRTKFEPRVFKAKDPDFMGWRIWHKPKATHTYVLGVDSAEGKGKDASVIQVLDCNEGLQVANFWSNQIDEDNFAAEIYKGGYYFNKARAIIEVNGQSGGAVVSTLSGAYSNSLRYPYLYKRYEYDEYTRKKTKKIGWRTTSSNKGLIIANLKAALRDGDLKLCDKYTIKELTTFMKDEKTGKQGAKGKNRDDRIMSLALAWEQFLVSKLSLKHTRESDLLIPREYDSETGFQIG